MRIGLIPESEQERAALERGPHIRVLLEPFLALAAARAPMAFVRLGLADALAGGGRTAAELAASLGLRPEGLAALLRVLAAALYVRENDGLWELTELSRATLAPGAPAPLEAWLRHNEVHWRAFGGLEAALAADGDRDVHHRLQGPEEWAAYQRAMLETALPAAEAVAAALPEPPGRDSLLDLGGSHGLYGAAVCRRFPGLRSLVLELPEAVDHARAAGEAAGVAGLVDYEAGDVLTADLGDACRDLVFMGNLVHHFDQAQLAGVLERVRRALKPGGVAAVWDMAPPDDAAGPDMTGAAFSLLFDLASASSCRPPEAHAAALEAAGLVDVAIDAGISPTHRLITARRP